MRTWQTRRVPGPTMTALRIDAGDVILRKAREDDREAIIAHVTDPEVQAHLGGPQPTGGRRARPRRGGHLRGHRRSAGPS